VVVDGDEEPASVAVEAEPDVTAAESSKAEGVETSISDAVLAALKSKEASPTSEDTGNEPPLTKAAEKPSEADDPETGLSKAELNRYSPNAQTRIRELAAHKNAAMQQVESLKPKAEVHDKIVNHLLAHDISTTEFDQAIEVTRLVKHDPARAIEVLVPLMQELFRRDGRILPPELQERVRLGHLQHQDALQITQAQARERQAAERAEAENRRRERADQERQQRALRERVDGNAQAVDQWAKAKAVSDPDWLTKQPLIAEVMELELRRAGPNGYPRNGAESVALVERSLAAVEARLKSYQPKLQQIKPVTGQAASSRAQAVPKDAVEAAFLALNRG
jgi:hypothetical protein